MTHNTSTRTISQANEVLCAIEEKHNLFSLELDGVSAWCFLREAVGQRLRTLPLDSAPSPLSRRVSMFIQTLKGCIKDCCVLARKRSIGILGVGYASTLSANGEGIEDSYLDGFLQHLPDAYKICSPALPSASILQQMPFPPLLGMSLPLLARGMTRHFLPPRTKELSVARRIADALSPYPELREFTPTYIAKLLRGIRAEIHWHSFVLSRLNPKCVLVINQGELALSAAAKSKNIPVYELQHGIFPKDHPGLWPRSVNPFARSIPLRAGFLLQGEFWREQLIDSSVYSANAFHVVGSPLLDSFRTDKRRKESSSSKKTIHILASITGLNVASQLAFWEETVKLLDKDVFVTIKPHPRYDKGGGIYDQLQRYEQVTVLPPSEISPSIFSMLASVDMHVAASTACHYDALGMGIPSVLIPGSAEELIDDLIRMNALTRVSSPEELADIIRNRSLDPPDDHLCYRLFEPSGTKGVDLLGDKIK